MMMGCEDRESGSADIRLIEVNSSRVPCTGIGPSTCLQVRERGTDNNWTLFYDDIKGFEYEPGYLYLLKLRVESLDPSQVPADGSSLRYSLISIEEKMPDPLFLLNDIWAVQTIEGRPYASEQVNPLYLELQIARRQFMGNDGCNQIRGTIEGLIGEEIRFSIPAKEAQDCQEEGTSSAFLNALSRVNRYKRNGLILQLLNDDTELLKLKKVD